MCEIWNKDSSELHIEMHIRDFFETSIDLFYSSTEVELWISKLVSMSAQRVAFSDSLKFSSGKTVSYSYVPLPEGLNLVRFLDTTDSTSLKKALKEKTDMISQVDKLKTDMISSISYELTSPLNTISGFAEILQNKYFGKLNDKQLEYCDGIKRSVERLTEIVEAIISLASIEAGQMKLKYEEVILYDFINEMIDIFNSRTKIQGISLKTDFNDKKITIFIDRQSLQQAVFQLISKALRVTPNGGEIVISVTFSKENQDCFELIVKDSGMGLSEEDLDKARKSLLYDASSGSADNSIEFGLILANNIIRLHNGKMLIDSSKSTGTTVRCVLPIRQFLQ
jgi:signal transduction histidine kinase